MAFLLVGCGNQFNPNNDNGGGPSDNPNQPIDNADAHTKDNGIDEDITSETEIDIKIKDEDEVIVNDPEEINEVTDVSNEGISYDEANKLFTITSAGEYTFQGEMNGNILVNAGEEDEIKLTLNGFTIKSTTDSPIKCISAGELQVSVKKGTKNYVYDYRDTKTVDDDNQGNGAITSYCDMKVSGKGSLVVVGKYYNGIHCKDDLKLKAEVNENSSIQIQSYNNCLKGNDSVEIESGNYVLISTNGNGIITENTDISSNTGKQRGSVSITGGHIDIYSAKDGIDAAYNVDISAAKPEAAPILNVYTSNYSQYSNEVSDTSEDKIYIRLSSRTDTSSYYYAVEFLNSDYTTTWKKASASSTSSSYKYLAVDKPSQATSFKVACFKNAVTTMSEDNAYLIMSSYSTINDYYDTIKVSVSSLSLRFDGWTSYQTTQPGRPGDQMGGGMQEGNNDKAEVSAKGIKAENEINISDGTFFIKTYDDAIHTNYGTAFENGATGIGDINISGGTFSIYASDDGLHADHALNISGGTIDVEYSYEGLEGNIINISGGYTKVYSIDDGLNAANKSNVTPSILVSGGIIDVTVYGQDVDGIDSNGTFTQTGGYVITKGGNSQMSTGLDCDGAVTVNGGTFIAFGKTEKTPSKGSGVSSYTLTGSYSIGSYNVALPESETITVTTKYSYTYITVYSNLSTKVTVTKA